MREQILHRLILRALATAASAFVVVATGGVLVAARQAPAPVWTAAPVFTATQATAGKAAYARECASCHLADLSGDAEIPALAGAPFKSTWGTRSTKDLFDYMAAAMPYGRPSLSAEAYASILAYILQANGAVAGTEELSATTVVPIGGVTAAPGTPP